MNSLTSRTCMTPLSPVGLLPSPAPRSYRTHCPLHRSHTFLTPFTHSLSRPLQKLVSPTLYCSASLSLDCTYFLNSRFLPHPIWRPFPSPRQFTNPSSMLKHRGAGPRSDCSLPSRRPSRSVMSSPKLRLPGLSSCSLGTCKFSRCAQGLSLPASSPRRLPGCPKPVPSEVACMPPRRR